MESSSQSMSMGTTVGHFSSEYFRVSTPDGRNCTLLEAVSFKRPDSVGGEIIELPVGSTSDGASTPAALWIGGFTPFGQFWRAAFLHDAIFRRQTIPPIDNFDKANLIFYEALVASGVPEVRARFLYNGVCEGGQRSWDRDRDQTT